MSKQQPTSFLERHVVAALTTEPSWTLDMYAAYNDIDEETTESLRRYLWLFQMLPERQLARAKADGPRAIRLRDR